MGKLANFHGAFISSVLLFASVKTTSDPCAFVLCPYYSSCKVIQKDAVCFCPSPNSCPKKFRPVCGTNYKIYHNRCFMMAESCSTGNWIFKQKIKFCAPKCSRGRKTGPCDMKLRRWYFNKKDRMCKPFIYGGCQSNRNNFLTKDRCVAQCTSFSVWLKLADDTS